MTLFKAIHATKVLALAGLVIATSCIPVRAGDWGGPPEVQTRTRHIRLHSHRAFPRHDFDRMGFRDGRSRNRLPRHDWSADNGPPEVETRTRHVRLPRYRRYGERWGHHGEWVRGQAGRNIWTPDSGYDYRPDLYGGDEFPDIVPGIGTYAGGISAFRVPGNGIYFSQEGYYRYADDGAFAPPPRPKRAKIIVVSPQTMNRSCAWEHGVCVIRR